MALDIFSGGHLTVNDWYINEILRKCSHKNLISHITTSFEVFSWFFPPEFIDRAYNNSRLLDRNAPTLPFYWECDDNRGPDASRRHILPGRNWLLAGRRRWVV